MSQLREVMNMSKFIEFPPSSFKGETFYRAANPQTPESMNLGEAFDIMVDHGNGRLLRGMERLNTQYINRHVFENVSKECWYDRYELEINAYNMVLQEGTMAIDVIESCNKILGLKLEFTYSA
jgi:hypothetical protein